MGIGDHADFVEKGTPKIFAHKAAFDRTLGGWRLVEPLAVDNPDIHHPLVEGAEPHMDAGRRVLALTHIVAQNRDGYAAQIPDIDTRPGQPADQGPFEHARAAV